MASYSVVPKNLSKAINKSIETQSKRKFAKGIKTFQKKGIPMMKSAIDLEIENGRSPVQGHGKYQRYSDSYKDQIKRGKYPGKAVRPVNLKITGKMRKSLKGRPTADGFTLFYSDRKAKYHDLPGLARVLRKMLPTGKEKFNLSISNKLNSLLKSIFE